MNKVLLIGNLTRDPEISTTQSGKTKAVFTLAVTRSYANQQGGRDADFIRCIAFDKPAELVGKYLTKGRKTAVEACIRTGSYEKDGQKVYTQDVTVQRVEFLSSPNNAAQQEPVAIREEVSNPTGEFVEVQDDDDLPF